MTRPSPPSTTSSAGSFKPQARPRGKRGTAALTISILASVASVAVAIALYVLFGLLFGPGSSWGRGIHWPAFLILQAALVLAPAAIAGLVAGTIAEELGPDDDGYTRGRVAVRGAFLVALVAPLASIAATALAHAGR